MPITKSIGQIILAIALLALTSSCTLRARNKAEGAPKDKPAGQTPATNGNGGAQPTQPLDAVIDPTQLEVDINDFKNPLVSIPTGTASQNTNSHKKFTGFFDESLGYFTDSAGDYLVPIIRSRQNHVDEAQLRQSRVDFARQIKDIHLVPSDDSNYSIEIVYKQPLQDSINIVLTGKASAESSHILLSQHSPNSHTSQNSPQLYGEMRCLDLKTPNPCSNYYLKLGQMPHDKGVFAEALIRTSPLKVTSQIISGRRKSPRVREISRILRKAFKDEDSDDRFAIAEMQSFAVVDGVAVFQIRLATTNNRFMYFKGPLTTDLGKVPTKLPVQLLPDSKEPTNAALGTIGENLLSDQTDAAFLIANNGAGELTLELDLDQKGTQDPAALLLTIARTLVPVTPINEGSVDSRP